MLGPETRVIGKTYERLIMQATQILYFLYLMATTVLSSVIATDWRISNSLR